MTDTQTGLTTPPRQPKVRLMPDDHLIPYRALPPFQWAGILALIRDAFAYMDARIDPPSSMHQLTPDHIAAKAITGEVWAIGSPPVACVFLTPQIDALYLGKLAVASSHRGQGLARRLIDLAQSRAQVLNLPILTLETRIELAENHAVFRALGFVETGRKSHAGYRAPTTISFARKVPRTDQA